MKFYSVLWVFLHLVTQMANKNDQARNERKKFDSETIVSSIVSESESHQAFQEANAL